MLKKNEVGPQTYRDAMARFAGAVHVITTDGVAGRRGATVIAACSVSDAPPTVLVCLNRENAKNEAFVQNGNFALNTLASDQQALAEWDRIATGAPALLGGLAVFDCQIIDSKDHATHRVLFGKVTGIRIGDTLHPLIYFNRDYRIS